MAHAERLGLKVSLAVHVGGDQHGDTAEDLDSHSLQALELIWVVGHELNALERQEGKETARVRVCYWQQGGRSGPQHVFSSNCLF